MDWLEGEVSLARERGGGVWGAEVTGSGMLMTAYVMSCHVIFFFFEDLFIEIPYERCLERL